MHKQLSLHTPSNLDLETLETFFVQRHDLLDRSVRWVRERASMGQNATISCLSAQEAAVKRN